MSNTLDKYDTARLLDQRMVILCETLTAKHAAMWPTSQSGTAYVVGDHKAGTRFVRIVQSHHGEQRSVHAFVDTTTGDLIKAAGWKAPAKRKNTSGVLDFATIGSLLDDDAFARIIDRCDPHGAYLYAR